MIDKSDEKDEKNEVTVVRCPTEPCHVYLEGTHTCKTEKPFPVRVSFDDTPHHVIVDSWPKKDPLQVDMNMKVSEWPPLCVKLCNEIVAKSEYRIEINIFDKPIASIDIGGTTVVTPSGIGEATVVTPLKRGDLKILKTGG